MSTFINSFCISLVTYGADSLMTVMLIVFVVGILTKVLMYILLRSELGFSLAFETRTHRYLNGDYDDVSRFRKFHDAVDYLLKRTFQEHYLKRKKDQRRRKDDAKVAVFNRAFLIEEGAKTLILDTLRQTRYHDNEERPDFTSISKFVFRSNPYFTKLWGFLAVGKMNSIFAILPSLFIIGGIFGTFLGISKALPMLKMINPSDVTGSQAILKSFLESMTFAMYSSVVGIFLSAVVTILNTFMSFNATYLKTVDKYTQCLDILWKDTDLHRRKADPETAFLPKTQNA